MMDSTARSSKLRVPTARGADDGRSKAARSTSWKTAVTPASDYHAAEESLLRLQTVRSSSSKSAHKGIRKDYIDFCALTGVDPEQLSVSTVAHVANFYFFRTKEWALSLSVSKHISAEMKSFFSGLGYKGRWTTGVDAAQNPVFFGNPNNSEDVDKVKKAHKIKIAQDGRVTLPVDPVEYGHLCAFYDHHLCGHVDVSPPVLAQHAAMMTAIFCLMRFDEVSNIR